MESHREFKIFCGNSNPSLAKEITRVLRVQMGKTDVTKFSNGETSVIVHESIRSHDAYVIQSTCANFNQRDAKRAARAPRGVRKLTRIGSSAGINTDPNAHSDSEEEVEEEEEEDEDEEEEEKKREENPLPPPDAPLALHHLDLPAHKLIPRSTSPRPASPSPASPRSTSPRAQDAEQRTTADDFLQNWSVNDTLMELLVMGDAFKRASCKQLIAVMPFFGYARQSKKHRSRTPITAKLVANMLQKAGFDRIITVDLHASQIQGFFDIPVDNIYVETPMIKYINKRIPGDKVVVAPGVGGVKRAKSIADNLNLDLAIFHKEVNNETGAKKMVLVGDVKDKIAVIIDDIADTCETLEKATHALIQKGAKAVYALITHGVLSDRALERINSMPLTELVITNTISNEYKLTQCNKIKVINLGPLLAEAIRRTNFSESLSSFFFSNKGF